MSVVRAVEKTRFYWLVTLDDGEEMRLGRQAMKDLPLHEGDQVEIGEYMSRLSARQYPRAMEAALSALDVGDKTEKKMREYLLRRYYPSACVDAVVEKLKEQGLIDDEKYALRYAETHPGEGKYALKRKLRARGVGEETSRQAADTLTDEGQEAAARKEAEKLRRRYAGEEPRDRKRKIGQALARRGFGWDVIERVTGADEEEDWEE